MLSKNKDGIKGIATGFKEFDAVTNGLQNSDLILLAARPGMGKTSAALNFATNAAKLSKKAVAAITNASNTPRMMQSAISQPLRFGLLF